jgi:hypothetical protein
MKATLQAPLKTETIKAQESLMACDTTSQQIINILE